MPTVPGTLAYRIRAKYPGAYDDLDDAALESAIDAKHPGAYDDIPRSTLPTRPVSAEDFAPPQPSRSWPAKFGDYFSNIGRTLNPLPVLEALSDAQRGAVGGDIAAAQRSLARLKGMGQAQVDQLKKAKTAVEQGRYSEAAGYGAAGVVPLIGPAAAGAGEQIGSGDVAGGLGTATGLLAPFGAKYGAEAVRSVRVPGLLGVSKEPGVAQAVEAGRAAGIPIDAATATGNAFVRAAQKVADESLAGSVIGGRARTAQQAALETQAARLAARAHPTPTTATQAGEAAQRGVRGVIDTQRAIANEAYDRLRAIEADPAHAVEIAPDIKPANPDAPFRFTMKAKPTADEVFADALKDARANGYTGTVGDLRATFTNRMEQARGLKSATAEGDEYSHAALLKEIRDRGGLRPFEKDIRAGQPTRQLREEAQGGQSAARNYYGKNAVYKTDGLATDDMLQQLSEDPKWGAVISTDTDLHEAIQSGAALKPALKGNVEDYLRGVGVKPGAQWWREGEASKVVPLAVDLSETKAAMRPIHDALAAEHAIVPFMSESGKGKAFLALDRLMKGPDAAPLSVADAALSQLKSMARSKDANLRTAGQGIALKAVDNLHRAVSDAAERAGPEAVSALEEGRTATKAKYAADAVLRGIAGVRTPKSGATAVKGLTSAGDVAAPRLRDVLKQSPDTKPLIARAVLDSILDSPTAGPDATWKAWQRMGPDTRNLLYAPDHAQAISEFLLLRKKIAQNPNPSGSGLTVLKGGEVAALVAGQPLYTLTATMMSALLHSPTGVKVLTRGFRVPLMVPAARAQYVSALSKALQEVGQPALTPAYADTREPPR